MNQNRFIINKGIKCYYIIQYLQLIIGCGITALGFNLFLAPNQIASGGIAGISLLIKHVDYIEPAITQWLGNIILFFIGLFLLSKKFMMRTVFGSLVLPLFIFLTTNLHPVTLNPLLGSIYGGLLSGIGLGLVFKSDASTGGTSIVASIINKYAGITIGNSQGIIDGAVIVAAAFVFDAEKALYAIISLFITSKAIDLIQLGFSGSKVAFIVSSKSEVIKDVIIKDLNRGITKISGFGGYTGEERTILMVVMNQSEVNIFKSLIKSIDTSAFIIISDTYEVLGQGFNLNREIRKQNQIK
ncbi:YitT family protein [Clostridium sp. WILCCON 0269]|uniref:YitT family protein n=1 Tax=Candidatus Clostridium eludens TaxID=3381663 RepID=A0ABW8SR63_9CLOT